MVGGANCAARRVKCGRAAPRDLASARVVLRWTLDTETPDGSRSRKDEAATLPNDAWKKPVSDRSRCDTSVCLQHRQEEIDTCGYTTVIQNT